jgi:hypothetical protein
MINRVADYARKESESRSAPNGPSAPQLPSFRQWVEPLEDLIKKHPAACLASAFTVGVVIAWWIKRK